VDKEQFQKKWTERHDLSSQIRSLGTIDPISHIPAVQIAKTKGKPNLEKTYSMPTNTTRKECFNHDVMQEVSHIPSNSLCELFSLFVSKMLDFLLKMKSPFPVCA
jgi:hypothetical protein